MAPISQIYFGITIPVRIYNYTIMIIVIPWCLTQYFICIADLKCTARRFHHVSNTVRFTSLFKIYFCIIRSNKLNESVYTADKSVFIYEKIHMYLSPHICSKTCQPTVKDKKYSSPYQVKKCLPLKQVQQYVRPSIQRMLRN